MSDFSLLKFIFSIKNTNDNKIITILGKQIIINIRKKNNKICKNTPIDPDTIVFMNYLGRPYGCNPKYIAQEIIRRKLPYKMIWIKNPKDKDFQRKIPSNMTVANYKKRDCYEAFSGAKLWVSNYHLATLMKFGLEKKYGQYYIQTWHGSLGIKKIEKNVKLLTNDKIWEKFSILNSKSVDYWISNSEFETEIYKEAFWDVSNEKIKEFGHPRNDIFFKTEEEKAKIIKKVHNIFNIPENQKIFLYIPTFRDSKKTDCFEPDFTKVKYALEEKFGKEWVTIVRLHPHVDIRKLKKQDIFKSVVNGTTYPDVQELLLAADALITDYSSCIFDFMLSKKPAFIFATDIEYFNNERGFYYPLEETPFPIASNNEQLIKNIANFNSDEYKIKVDEFIKGKGCIEDGHAAERVVDLIEEIMSRK